MNELVFKGDNAQALTNSILVAGKFGKEHKDVLRAIKEITSAQNCAFVENQQVKDMFVLVENEVPMPVGGGVRKQPMYVMNRDGFTLLAMGFTGKEAMKFKLEYIAAFNAMEKQMKSLSAPSYQIEDPIERAKKWIEEQKAVALLESEKKRLEYEAEQKQEVIELQTKEIEKSAPKVEYYDKCMQSEDTVTTTQVAKEFGMDANKLNKKLRDAGVQFRQSGQWLLHAPYSTWGLHKVRTQTFTRSDGSVGMNTYTVWTQRGRRFIHALKECDWVVKSAINLIKGEASKNGK